MKKGWQTQTLGEACEMYQPKTISGKDMVEDGAYPVYGANGVIGRYNQFNHEEPQLLITCRGATCGSVNISAPRSWVTGNAMVVRPKNESLEMRYLEYLFRGGIDISKAITGAAQPQITRTNLEPLKISFPESLAEQQRIVGLLDEAFEGLATAKANAEKNLQNARALFESHLQSVFPQRGAGWVEKRLDELCTFSSGGTPSKSNSSYWSGKIPWISGRDMKSTRLSDSFLHISKSAVDESSTRMAAAGTLLILVRGMGLAHGAQIAELTVPCAFNQDIRGIHAKPGLLPRYLLFALRDGINSSDTVLSNAAHGTLKIDSNELQKVVIPFPPLEQQRRIVAAIDALTEETQRLARLYERKHAALAALQKSLLHQAFTGEL